MHEVFEKLLKRFGITTYKFCKDTGVNASTISTWKKNKSLARPDLAKKVCEYFGVSMDYLMTGKEDEKSEIVLTEKDEKDIQRRIERAITDLEKEDALMFDGEPLDDATRAALMESLASSIRIAKIQAKQKFGRKKKNISKDNE